MLLILLPLLALAPFITLKQERFSPPQNSSTSLSRAPTTRSVGDTTSTITLPHWGLLTAVAMQKKKTFLVTDLISLPSYAQQVPPSPVQHLPGGWDPLLHPVRHRQHEGDHWLRPSGCE